MFYERFLPSKRASGSDMADKYRLRVTAGPTYDPETHKPVPVNEPTPMRISTDLADINLHVRIKNFRGTNPKSPSTSPYFTTPPHLSDLYSISFSLLPKKSINGDSLVFGNDFDHPVRDSLPPGFSLAFNIVKRLIDPGLYGDPYADEPYLYGPALSSLNILHIGEKTTTLPTQPDESVLTEGATGEDATSIRAKASIPPESARRMKHFLNDSARQSFVFEPGRLYQTDFFNPFLDFGNFALKLPGFSFSIVSYWDKEPHRTHSLRYVLKDRESGTLLFVVVLETVPLKLLESREAEREADEKRVRDGEGAFRVDEDDEGVD
ncbi:MAG: hypothetical protein M1824_001400 [Vezdaea acicularis]|nr:MAG: hypothetical protein M1824_001400 [Vezdaea acicularis]